MSKGAEFREIGRLPGEDERPNKTSVVPPAEGPPAHGCNKDELVEEELSNPESITARNPNPAETRS
jgi:hypothetical protein